MIERIKITNYQSLVDVDLSLAGLTVIVGPSSSGKSSLVRALHTLAHNQRGAAFITQGKAGCSISATTAAGTLTLTRSRTSSASDAYVLNGQRFTKLGGSTPAEVTAFLGQAASPEAIASQFDPPYLLTQSPAEAARTLASITNASIVLEAARESNRRKLDAASTLRIRSSDLATTQNDLRSHEKHASALRALESATCVTQTARSYASSISALNSATTAIRNAAAALRTLRQDLASHPQLPDLDAATILANKISGLRALLDQIAALQASRRDLRSAISSSDQLLSDLEQQRSDLLAQIGVCPTCGAATH